MHSLLLLMLTVTWVGVLLFIAMAIVQLIALFIGITVMGVVNLVKLAFHGRS